MNRQMRVIVAIGVLGIIAGGIGLVRAEAAGGGAMNGQGSKTSRSTVISFVATALGLSGTDERVVRYGDGGVQGSQLAVNDQGHVQDVDGGFTVADDMLVTGGDVYLSRSTTGELRVVVDNTHATDGDGVFLCDADQLCWLGLDVDGTSLRIEAYGSDYPTDAGATSLGATNSSASIFGASGDALRVYTVGDVPLTLGANNTRVVIVTDDLVEALKDIRASGTTPQVGALGTSEAYVHAAKAGGTIYAQLSVDSDGDTELKLNADTGRTNTISALVAAAEGALAIDTSALTIGDSTGDSHAVNGELNHNDGQTFDIETLTYAASVALNFSPTTENYKTVTVADAGITFTASNLAVGRWVTVRVVGNASTVEITWPGADDLGLDSSLAANKVLVCTLFSWGTVIGDVTATCREQT